ncbi:MAG TPA: DUF6178 family protein [Polyangiaceae bacterium]|nr:DUF6178 family protein [Polyangiaceae bacterium]
MLETPELPAQIQALPGPVLGKLIGQVGLEDAGELVALATTQQLADIFDEELWHSAEPGQDERFDSERFLLWLEVMHEAGDRFVAERLAELPQELVTLAFHRHLLVLTEDALRAELSGDDDEAEAAEKAFESCQWEELSEYQLIWRGGDGFDAVFGALVALDREHHAALVGILERCAALSREFLDDNGGLYEVLSSEEMLESDLSAEREARRAERGYVAPSAAAAFLRLARLQGAAATSLDERDALTRAYFRELRMPSIAREPARPALPGTLGVGPAANHDVPLLIQALRVLAESAPAVFAERSEELAYLSNVLVAGCSLDGRRLRPLEAVEHAITAVSLGLWLVSGAQAGSVTVAASELERQPADVLLRRAFHAAGDSKLRLRPKSAAKALSDVRTLLRTMKV